MMIMILVIRGILYVYMHMVMVIKHIIMQIEVHLHLNYLKINYHIQQMNGIN